MKQIFGVVAVLLLAFTTVACSEVAPSARVQEQAKAQANQAALNASIPIPPVKFAQERHGLVRRSEIINVQNLTGCVMLFTPNGQLVGKFVTDGKVSSLNSYLLSSQQLVSYRASASAVHEGFVVEQPDIDGAYGANAEGVFFIDASTGALIEWTGPHFWSNQCLDTNVQPLVVSTAPAE